MLLTFARSRQTCFRHRPRGSKTLPSCRACAATSLIGYGLVVGAGRHGRRHGRSCSRRSRWRRSCRSSASPCPQERLKVKNVAAVMVTATLPAFVRNGSTVDVTVSSLWATPKLPSGRHAAANAFAGRQRAGLRGGAGRGFCGRFSGRRRGRGACPKTT